MDKQKQKDKNSYKLQMSFEERFDEVLQESKITERASFCREMHKKFFIRYRDKINFSPDPKDPSGQSWVDNTAANLKKYINGEKPFPALFILAAEAVLKKPFYEIVFGNASNKKDQIKEPESDGYEQLSLEYVARMNDYDVCARYSEKRESLDLSPLISRCYDEFDRNIFEYIIEREREGYDVDQIIKYLIDNNELELYDIYYRLSDEDQASKIIDIVLSYDDPSMFEKFTSNEHSFYRVREDEKWENFFKKLSETKNIFNLILKPITKKYCENNISAPNRLFVPLLQYCIREGLEDKSNELITAYENYINDTVSKFFDKTSEFRTIREWHGAILYKNDEAVCELALFEKEKEIAPEKFREITIEAIERRFLTKNLDELADGDSIINVKERKIYYKYKNPPSSIKLYCEMTKSGHTCIPQTYYKGNDIYESEWEDRRRLISFDRFAHSYDTISSIFKVLGEVHSEMLKLRGDGKVNVYPTLCAYHRISENYFISFLNSDSQRCATPEEAFITILIETFNDRIDKFHHNESAELIKEAVKEYAIPEVIQAFGDKLLQFIDEKLEESSSRHNYPNFCKFNLWRGFAAWEKDELNSIATEKDGAEC